MHSLYFQLPGACWECLNATRAAKVLPAGKGHILLINSRDPHVPVAVAGDSAREVLLFPELNSLGFKAPCWRKSPFLLEAQT